MALERSSTSVCIHIVQQRRHLNSFPGLARSLSISLSLSLSLSHTHTHTHTHTHAHTHTLVYISLHISYIVTTNTLIDFQVSGSASMPRLRSIRELQCSRGKSESKASCTCASSAHTLKNARISANASLE